MWDRWLPVGFTFGSASFTCDVNQWLGNTTYTLKQACTFDVNQCQGTPLTLWRRPWQNQLLVVTCTCDVNQRLGNTSYTLEQALVPDRTTSHCTGLKVLPG
jgi:hypothetical protein